MSVSSILGGLSTQCQGGLTSLLTSSFASCANIVGLVSVVSGSGSIVEPLNTWIADTCTSAPCTSSELSNASSIITNACSTELSGSGDSTSSSSIIPYALNLIISQYGDVRSLICTQRTSNSSYCLTELLTNAQTASGTQFTLSTLSSLTAESGSSLLSAIPSSVYCTDCGHALFTGLEPILKNVSSETETALSTQASSTCGASFVDGQLPSGISTAGATGLSSASSTGNNGAASKSTSVNKLLAIAGTLAAAAAGASLAL